MTRAELLQRLRELKSWLESQGVVDLRLFGSFARDESDVDLETQMTIDAVALNLLVIGECANGPPPAMTLRSTPPWSKMVALRHRIAHGCTSVDPDLPWDVAQDSLPELIRELDVLEAR